ncbi:hypothetical protein ACW4TU_39665 [Streptomyces sp. QTS52]
MRPADLASLSPRERLNTGVARTVVGFGEDDLRALAGVRSFDRGLGYLDAVTGLEVEEGSVTAVVHGTDIYEVELSLGGTPASPDGATARTGRRAAEAVRRGYEVRPSRSYYSRREGGVDVVVDGFGHAVTVRQEFPQSTNPERSARLVVELDHGRSGQSGRPVRWRDRKDRVLEDALGLILGEIEVRVLEDAQRRKDEERAAAERAVCWRAAVEKAKERAVRDQLAEVLREEAERWREAAVLGEYCTALERRLGELGGAMDEAVLDSARRWLEWAYGYARALDPVTRFRGCRTRVNRHRRSSNHI